MLQIRSRLDLGQELLGTHDRRKFRLQDLARHLPAFDNRGIRLGKVSAHIERMVSR